MKFHWADFLNRDGGHWQMTPNAERGKYWSPERDCTSFPKTTKIASVRGDNTNFEALRDLEQLEELTLHETNQDQIDQLTSLPWIKRLRITHARPKTLNALAQLPNVEELVLEYVSGFDDLTPVGQMPKLRSLYMENLRRVTDFSPLKKLSDLRCLQVTGTWDWRQPVQSVEFIGELTSLEFLWLWVVSLKDFESAKNLARIGDRCDFSFMHNFLPIEIFAYLEAHCANAQFEPVEDFGVLLGKGERALTARTKNPSEKRQEHRDKYYALVEAARKAGP